MFCREQKIQIKSVALFYTSCTCVITFMTASVALWLRHPPHKQETGGSVSSLDHTCDFTFGSLVATLPGA